MQYFFCFHALNAQGLLSKLYNPIQWLAFSPRTDSCIRQHPIRSLLWALISTCQSTARTPFLALLPLYGLVALAHLHVLSRTVTVVQTQSLLKVHLSGRWDKIEKMTLTPTGSRIWNGYAFRGLLDGGRIQLRRSLASKKAECERWWKGKDVHRAVLLF